MPRLNKPSKAQQEVIDYVSIDEPKYNVLVDSVAGSGKTTTILHIAKNNKEKEILCLTYNKKLKFETRDRVISLKLENIDVHSYHSFVVNNYDKKGYVDSGIRNFLKKDKDTEFKDVDYDIVIIDEIQDATPLYYELVCKIVKDIKRNGIIPQICIFGDRYQSIFNFNGSDERFIIFGRKLYNFNDYEWKKVSLNISFRLTKPMAQFINNCVLRKRRLKSIKNGTKVRYQICNTFVRGRNSDTFKEIKYYLSIGYKKQDIFVLAPSIRSDSSPCKILANELSKAKIPIYVPSSDEERLDEDVMKNKIVFSSFHQVKGLERKVVLVFCFDESYMFYDKNWDGLDCPNTIYVALTRAKEKLTVFHHISNNYLPFLKRANLYRTCNMNGRQLKIKKIKNVPQKMKPISVTDLLRFLKSKTIQDIVDKIDIVTINEPGKRIKLPSKTIDGDGCENVSEINGTAIPAYFELMTTGKMSIQINYLNFDIDENNVISGKNKKIGWTNNDIVESIKDVDVFDTYSYSDYSDYSSYSSYESSEESDVEIIFETTNADNITVQRLLVIATYYCCYVSGYNYKASQITNYNWLTKEQIEKCGERLIDKISNNAIFEAKMEFSGEEELRNRTIFGFIDCIDKNTIWEFKCVDEIKHEHILQLSIYAYLLTKVTKGNANDYSYKLFNILTGEIVELFFNSIKLEEIVEKIIRAKYTNIPLLNNTEFIQKIKQIQSNY